MNAVAPSRLAYHIAMDTTITIEVPGDAQGSAEAVRAAFGWFDEVERVCSRFDPDSELSRACRNILQPVALSPLLFHALSFALEVARASGGAFDPTVGARMVSAGFDRNYRDGRRFIPEVSAETSFLDVALDPGSQSVVLGRGLQLDLGAVAKGFAVDLAARELAQFPSFAINAGGDLFMKGRTAEGQPWRAGVRDPRNFDQLAESFVLDGMALCTSGDYERRNEQTGEHHLRDARSGDVAAACASVSVIAPTAMAADAFATAAFALGPAAGLRFLEDQGVEGLIITPGGVRYETAGLLEFLG